MLDTLVTHEINEAESYGSVTFQLAHNRPRVEMVATRHPQSLGQHSEVDTVDLLSIDDGVHGSVNVKQKTVFPTVPSQGSVGRESAGDVVMHDDGHAKMLGGLCSVQHALARAGRGIVQLVALYLYAMWCTEEGLQQSAGQPKILQAQGS